MSNIDTEAINKLNQYTDKVQKKYIKAIGEIYDLKYKLKYLERAYYSKDTLSEQNKINDISEPSFINLTEDNTRNINKQNKFLSETQEKKREKRNKNQIKKQNKSLDDNYFSEAMDNEHSDIKYLSEKEIVNKGEEKKHSKRHLNKSKRKPRPPISETESAKQIIKLDNLNNINIDNLEKILVNEQKPIKKLEQKLDTEIENKNNNLIERFKKDHPDEEIALAGGDPLISAIRWLNK